jgi:glycosyltransferase involved in cell wall biosynthesis
LASLVSIIIPTYNRELFIKKTLNSILNQTFKNWECIIVDDKSTDNTRKIINETCIDDSRFILIERYKEPKGAPTCRNIGLRAARGEYVIFLDSDDLLFKDALEERVRFLQANPDIGFCVSSGIRGRLPLSREEDYYLISSYNSFNVLEEFFAFTIPWGTHCPTYCREKLIENKIFWDENLTGFQDIDFHVKATISGIGYKYLEGKPDCLWRIHEQDNIGSKISEGPSGLEQKIYLYNKYSNNNHIGNKQISPLRSYLTDLYLNNYLPEKYPKDVLNSIVRPGIYPVVFLRKVILKLYRTSRKNKIRFIPTICRNTIMLFGGKYFFVTKTNTHFIKQKVNMPEIS